MKSFFKSIWLMVAVGFLVALTGCAITPPVTATKNDAVRLACTTATPGIDGKAVTACAVDAQQIDAETGKNKGLWARSVQVYDNLPTLGQVVTGLVPSAAVAFINRSAAKDVATINTVDCKAGGCGGTPPVIINNAANAGAVSQSQSGANVDIKSGGSCSTCGSLLK